jgi:hypothetical protein
MQESARGAFIEMVRDCGNDIVRMEASFEMFLGQYLTEFPEERKLLSDAFKVGVPQKMIQHAGKADYADYLTKLGPRFAEAANRPEDESAWAIETWSLALGRTSDYVAPVIPNRVYIADEIEAQETPEKKFVANAGMATIVTAGGGIGAAMAALLFPLALAGAGMTDDFVATGGSRGQYRTHSEFEQIVLFVVIGLVAATVGGVAALGGWLLGKGAEYPWATFGVACGTAFTMFFIITFIPVIPMLVKPVLYFASVFGTTYKSAARGGNY